MEMPPNRIEELREEAGLARASLAVVCHVGEMTIRRWARNESAVPDDQKFRLAEALEEALERPVSVEHLMGWDRIEPKAAA